MQWILSYFLVFSLSFSHSLFPSLPLSLPHLLYTHTHSPHFSLSLSMSFRGSDTIRNNHTYSEFDSDIVFDLMVLIISYSMITWHKALCNMGYGDWYILFRKMKERGNLSKRWIYVAAEWCVGHNNKLAKGIFFVVIVIVCDDDEHFQFLWCCFCFCLSLEHENDEKNGERGAKKKDRRANYVRAKIEREISYMVEAPAKSPLNAGCEWCRNIEWMAQWKSLTTAISRIARRNFIAIWCCCCCEL